VFAFMASHSYAQGTLDLRLNLGGQQVDLATQTRARIGAPKADVQRGLWLVQYQAPIKQLWLDRLLESGLAPLQYIHPNTYVVWGAADRAESFSGQSEVHAVAAFAPDYKTALAPEGGNGPYRLMLVRAAGVDAAQLAQRGAEELGRATLDQHFEQVLVTVSAQRVADLAALAGVFAIETLPQDGGTRNELSNQLYANNVATTGSPPAPLPGYLSWLAGRRMSGSGVLIANVDSGVDETHPDLVARMRACTGTTCGGAASSHGTHTAGIMAGDGASGATNAQGFRRGLGVAPGANLIEQRYSPFFQQAGGMLLLMRESALNGALVSGNSWGPAGSPRGYDQDTRQVDVGTRDTQADVAGDQPLTFVVSMMNGNGGTSTQGTPDEAKNIITVGSTRANSGATLLEWREISSNSGHGPALDGRTIPHLVAPGCSVESTVPGGYSLLCGTSMASPHVTGGVALFAQGYRNRFGGWPSPAMSKASMVVHTENMVGRRDASGGTMGNRPDSKQGFGRARLDRVLDTLASSMLVDQSHVFENSGENWSVRYRRRDASQPIQILLTFTDAPGAGLGGITPAWVNNLDLQVRFGAQMYRGNVFGSDALSATGGAADGRNNIELVALPPGTSGDIEISVLASAINGDALPNIGDATQQDFALICVNCEPDLPAGSVFRNGFEN